MIPGIKLVFRSSSPRMLMSAPAACTGPRCRAGTWSSGPPTRARTRPALPALPDRSPQLSQREVRLTSPCHRKSKKSTNSRDNYRKLKDLPKKSLKFVVCHPHPNQVQGVNRNLILSRSHKCYYYYFFLILNFFTEFMECPRQEPTGTCK